MLELEGVLFDDRLQRLIYLNAWLTTLAGALNVFAPILQCGGALFARSGFLISNVINLPTESVESAHGKASAPVERHKGESQV